MSLIILFLLHMIDYALLEESCPFYTCSSLQNHICSESLTKHIELQACPHYYTCGYSPTKKSFCERATYEYKELAFPGGKCSTNSDCLNTECINSLCTSSSSSCKDNSDCPFTTKCFNKQCIAPSNKGDTCTIDSDCVWPLGCFKEKCTPFFSIENGSEGDSAHPFFCMSGKVYNGKCGSVNDAIDDQCSDSHPCSYFNPNGQSIIIDTACVCRYQSNDDTNIDLLPSKTCLKGDINNPYWQTAITLLKQSIDKANANQCNADEARPGYCRETLRNSWLIRNKAIELRKSLILSSNINLISPALSPCLLKSVLQFDDTPPSPRNNQFQCPTYRCNDKDNETYIDNVTCAYSINPFNEAGNEIIVELKETCQEKYRCNYDLAEVFLNWTSNSTCKEIPTDKSWRHKYPGEECTSHLQCIKGSNESIGICIDGICSGRKAGESCIDHGDCLKGLFCNGLHCQDQKKEDGFCLEAFHCRNYLGCLNNTCVPYYSLSNGTFLNQTNPDVSLCKMGIMNQETKQCAEEDYYELPSDKRDKEGFVQCDIGEKCRYTTGFYYNNKPVVTERICACGYRENGKAYCPIPQSINMKEWKKYYKLKNMKYDNKCHTLRRDECVEEMTFKDQDELNYYKRNTINAHLFYKSDKCIIKILHSAIPSISLILLMTISILLL